MITKTATALLCIYSLIFFSAVEAKTPTKAGVIALAPLMKLEDRNEQMPPNSKLVDQLSEFAYGTNTVAKASVKPAIVFKHGDISWLPELATQAGWKPEHFKKLGQIILRESGGCPNRIGSSIVDANCNITGYTKATNKSDSGLMQINGVNWNPKRNKNAVACVAMKICTQAPLLDAVTNLKVGKLLYDRSNGWGPWDICRWNPTAKSCKKKN